MSFFKNIFFLQNLFILTLLAQSSVDVVYVKYFESDFNFKSEGKRGGFGKQFIDREKQFIKILILPEDGRNRILPVALTQYSIFDYICVDTRKHNSMLPVHHLPYTRHHFPFPLNILKLVLRSIKHGRHMLQDATDTWFRTE